MELIKVKVDFPGLVEEKLPSGNRRWRVRREGNHRQRLTLNVSPDHPDFPEHYRAARAGILLDAPAADTKAVPGSLAWLGDKYLAAIKTRTEAGQTSPATLAKKEKNLRKLKRLCGEYDMKIPTREIERLRDGQATTPAAADDFVTFLRTMFDWAMREQIMRSNPAAGIDKIDPGHGGATPWSAEDLRQYLDHHKAGTTPHLAMMLLLFTGCRVGDLATLGKGNEFVFEGDTFLRWQPGKRGSKLVEVIILPQLQEELQKLDAFRKTYVVSQWGRPFKTAATMSNRIRTWSADAGLRNRSAHGVRKALATLLAEMGCTNYQIMAVLGHTNPKTSEVYTETVNRRRLAREAMASIRNIRI